MEDGKVQIKTEIDNSELAKGIREAKSSVDKVASSAEKAGKKAEQSVKKASKSLKEASKETKSWGDKLKEVADTPLGTIGTIGAVVGAIKKTGEAIGECVNAYKTQVQAENALQSAAKNNPYLDGSAVDQLKAYASELQSVSNVGDEEMLPLMAQLAAAGRTQAEIQAIMKASLDVSASGAMSLDSAVRNLNKTFSGLSGELGESVPQIKELTEEELKNGKAIEVIQKQYKGMASATIDSTKQLANTWGDFKEHLGSFFNSIADPLAGVSENIISKMNSVFDEFKRQKQMLKDYNDLMNRANNGEATKEEYQYLLDNFKVEAEKYKQELAKQKEISNPVIEKLKEEMATVKNVFKGDYQELIDIEQEKIDEISRKWVQAENARFDVEMKLKDILDIEKQLADEAEREKKATEEITKEKERQKTAAEYKEANTKALNDQLEKIKLLADLTGEEATAQELYNLYLNSYVDLITKSNGLVTENNELSKERLAKINEYKQAMDEITQAEQRQALKEEQEKKINDYLKERKELYADIDKQLEERKQAEADDLLSKVPEKETKGIVNNYTKQQDELTKLKQNIIDNEIIAEEEKANAIQAIDEELAQSKKDLYHDLADETLSYVNQIVDITKQASDIMLENTRLESELELSALDEKYTKGELSEEEFYEKRKQLKKKAAQDEYKIAMFQWNMSLLTAMANIAEGVTKAIGQGGIGGIITGALVSAAGALQLATIGASKPIPPSFATGGIVGGANGATMGSDNTYIHARNGEMIMNATQQRTLWNMINSRTGSQAQGLNITINNTQSNKVSAQVRQNNGALILDIVDKHINNGFSTGSYDSGIASMNARQEGARFL